MTQPSGPAGLSDVRWFQTTAAALRQILGTCCHFVKTRSDEKTRTGLKEFQCYCWIFGFCQSGPEVLSLVFTVAAVFVVKLKTSPPLKGKLLHMSPPLPSPPPPAQPGRRSLYRASDSPFSQFLGSGTRHPNSTRRLQLSFPGRINNSIPSSPQPLLFLPLLFSSVCSLLLTVFICHHR